MLHQGLGVREKVLAIFKLDIFMVVCRCFIVKAKKQSKSQESANNDVKYT
jgi:hypothetical protein